MLDADLYTTVRVDTALSTAVGVDAAYLPRLGWVLPISIAVGVVAAPLLLLLA